MLDMQSDVWTLDAREMFTDIVALRRAIHEDPELGLDCQRTTARLLAALQGLPLDIRRSTRTSGFIAILRGERPNGRTVLLRGDMDALPMSEETDLPFASKNSGIMHACGHDAHAAMLVGAAKLLCRRKHELQGTILLMFQPGEEGYHGAHEMIEEGLLDDPAPDAAFALHVSPNMPSGVIATRPGPLLASMDTLKATVTGRGGHAAMPHDALDPIPVACEIVMALQTAVTRRVPAMQPGILSVTQFNAGTAANVIPSRVDLVATLRAISEDTRELLHRLTTDLVVGVAAAHGLTGEAIIDRGYPVVMNDPRAFELISSWARSTGAFVEVPDPVMGSEDFAYVLQRFPGAMAVLGAAQPHSDPARNPTIHNTRMMIDESAMIRGMAFHCGVAQAFLQNGWPA